MILLDVVDAETQKFDSSQAGTSGVAARTVRHPENSNRSSSSSSLPDYFESQAEAEPKPEKKRFKTGRRFWRNVAIILLVYVVLSVVIAVAAYLTVRGPRFLLYCLL